MQLDLLSKVPGPGAPLPLWGFDDPEMHDNVLESIRFPDAVFSPDRVNGRLAPMVNRKSKCTALCAFMAVEHEMTIPVRVIVQNDQVTAKAKFAVPYVDWLCPDGLRRDSYRWKRGLFELPRY